MPTTCTAAYSQECVAGALCALSAKHVDNRALVAKRLVGLLVSPAAKSADRAVRVLMTCGAFASDSYANQVAVAKIGGVPPLISWLAGPAVNVHTGTLGPGAQAAQALLCVAFQNAVESAFCAPRRLRLIAPDGL